MATDQQAVAEDVKKTPEDVERTAFYAAAIGILRTTRLLVILCLLIEIFGRIVQISFIYLPGLFPPH